MRRSGASFKHAVNHYLRLGLTRGAKPAGKRFVVAPLPISLPAGLDYDNVAELLETLEGGEHR